MAIARALITRPTVLLADEPTGNLDSQTGGEILELLRRSVDAYGQTTVMVTHDPRAAAIADRILFIADGRIVKELTRRDRRRGARRDGRARGVIAVALKGLAGAQAAGRADRHRDRAGGGDDQRHVRAHRHDQVGVRHRVQRSLQAHRRRSSPARARSEKGAKKKAAKAANPPPSRIAARERARPARRRAGPGRRLLDRPAGGARRQGARRGGAPGLAFSVHPHGNQRFNPLTLVAGNWPVGPGEVGIDANTAERHRYRVGETIGVIARGPEQRMRIAAIVRIGGVSSLGGATLAIFDFPVAQQLFHLEGQLTLDLDRRRARRAARRRSCARSRPLLPPNAQARTGVRAGPSRRPRTRTASSPSFQDFLLAFAGVALFVGAFVIANTLSITIAQRTRELATLRTLGATRRQVLRSVLLEALVIGLLASIAGLFLGLALAKGLNALFVSFGIDLPAGLDRLRTRTVVVSLLVGVAITVLAALRPAIRATRVPPIAAVHEGAVLPPSRFARFGPYAALATIAAAVALMLIGLFVGGLSTSARLRRDRRGRGAGCSSAWRCSRRRSYPRSRWSSAGRRRSSPGRPAGSRARNAMRNPARTASTAAALMIGLALVTLVAVLAAGLKSTFESSVNEIFSADYALTATNNFSPISTASAEAVGKVPGVRGGRSGVRAGAGRAYGKNDHCHRRGAERQQGDQGQMAVGLAGCPARSWAKTGHSSSKEYAKSHHLHRGSQLTVETPSGSEMQLHVRGIFAPPKGGSPYGDVTISSARFDSRIPGPAERLRVRRHRRRRQRCEHARACSRALQSFPNAKIQTESEFKRNQEKGIDTLLNLLYVLLSLSIIVSLFGIVNTLVLTVFERTRELGMLRAVGMTRRQLRSMIRHESVVTALIGAALGIPVGIVLALMVGQAIEYPVFTIPVGTLVVFVLAAILAGLLAAVFPARRAARLNVLEALQYE